jgi:hypothetical protein
MSHSTPLVIWAYRLIGNMLVVPHGPCCANIKFPRFLAWGRTVHRIVVWTSHTMSELKGKKSTRYVFLDRLDYLWRWKTCSARQPASKRENMNESIIKTRSVKLTNVYICLINFHAWISELLMRETLLRLGKPLFWSYYYFLEGWYFKLEMIGKSVWVMRPGICCVFCIMFVLNISSTSSGVRRNAGPST